MGVVGFAFHGSDCFVSQISCILVLFCRFCVDYLEESITGKDYKNPKAVRVKDVRGTQNLTLGRFD